MESFDQKIKFNPKAVAILIAVCVLISIFIPVSEAKACSPYCGDGQVNQSWEECDGDSPKACTTTGDYSGLKYCESCVWSDCQTNEYCGDGIKNGSEQCDGTDGLPANYTCSQECTLQASQNPSLTITKAVDKTFPSPGDEIIYTLNYQNTGDGVANNVVVKDPFTNLNQQYLTFISASPGPSSGNDTWNIGTLNPGQSGQITIRAEISQSISSWTIEIKNRASIDSNETSFKYSKYVSVFITSSPGLSINKLVRNISNGSGFSQSVTAEPGDEIEFSLEIKSTGTSSAINVKVWDNLPIYFNQNRLEYISDSTTVNGSSYDDGIINDGIYVGDLAPDEAKTIKFKAKVASEEEFYTGTTILTNYGYVRADNYYTIFDTATVKVEKESPALPVLISSDLNIDKLVRNITRGSTYWTYWTNYIYAEPGDEIEFLIKIKSTTSEEVDYVRVRDKLPPKMIYISDSTTIEDIYEPDGIVSKNIYLGKVYPNLYREIKFRAKVAQASKFKSYPITLINIAYAWGNDGKEIKDSAKIIVRKPTSPLGQALAINKLGRNISQEKDIPISSFSAIPEEEIEFSIQVTNIGNTDLSNVKVWDTLPAYLSIITNSTTIDGNSWSGNVTGAGLNLGTLAQAQRKTIKFRAKIASEDKFSPGSTTLINTAYASATDVSQVSDQSSVIVSKPGEVKGAAYVPTGANLIALLILLVISCFAAFIIYCRLRENKLLEILNSDKKKFRKSLIRFYFRLKFFFTATKMRFKRVYW